MEPIVRPASVSDREQIIAVVTAAFETEAAMNYFFGTDYPEHAPVFFDYLLDLRLSGGEVWVAVDGDAILAVAILNPPGGLSVSDSEVRNRWETVARGFPPDVRHRLDDYRERIGNQEPSTRHYYLSVLATDPAHRGRGLGRTVLGPVLTRADERGWDTYLETASSENVTIYERLGFTVEAAIDLPDGPQVRWMRRPSARQ